VAERLSAGGALPPLLEVARARFLEEALHLRRREAGHRREPELAHPAGGLRLEPEALGDRGRRLLRVRARLLLGDDVDSVLGEVLMQIEDLLAGRLYVLEWCSYLLRRQVAALAALGDDVAQLLDLGERHVRQDHRGRFIQRVATQVLSFVFDHQRRIRLYE
jgi:hypothetical protein